MSRKLKKNSATPHLPKCVCLIPFYNERKTIIKILGMMVEVKNIERIICIDDGSTDGAAELIKKKYPQVTLVVSPQNEGKSEAVKRGLDEVLPSEEYVLLFDADLKEYYKEEIERGVDYILKDPKVDMLIFKSLYETLVMKMARMDILVSGQRILRARDLREVYKSNPKGFQLETAINLYMMENNKKVYWVGFYTRHSLKVVKHGIRKGLEMDLKMTVNIIGYGKYKRHINSVLKFCREEYKPGMKHDSKSSNYFSPDYAKELMTRLSKKDYLSSLFPNQSSKK